MPFVSRTRATLRSAEFGFFGVTCNARADAALLGRAARARAVFVLAFSGVRGLRTS